MSASTPSAASTHQARHTTKRDSSAQPSSWRPLAAALVRSGWLALALWLAAPAAMAQSGRIQVEVLVFAYANPDAGAALSPADADPEFSGMLLGESGPQYAALAPGMLRLGGANDALARNARTRALVHLGWQQDSGATRAVRLRGSAQISSSAPERGALATSLPELDGDLSLRFGHGVEVHVDALLRVALKDRNGKQTGEQRFRLNSKRVLGYGEVHYLDHPAFGVIVRIDPVASAETSEP